MNQELIHNVELAANTLAIAVEPLKNIETKRAHYAREIARIGAIGVIDVMKSVDDGRVALEDTIEAMENLLLPEEDDEQTD